jgi:membrane fusion protein, heavy metal efflux system
MYEKTSARSKSVLFAILCGLLVAGSQWLGLASSASANPEKDPAAGDAKEQEAEDIIELDPEVLSRLGLKVEPAAPHVFSRIVRATGELTMSPDLVSRVGPRIEGRIVELKAKVGDPVQQGQALASLMSLELGRAKADYLSRKAKLELARSNEEREKGLRAKGISSEKELLEAEAEQTQAEIELASAESDLEVLGLSEAEIKGLKMERAALNFVVQAPISGQVIEREVTLGQMAELSSTLFVIANLSEVWAQLNLYEKDLATVDVGSAVTLRLDAFPDAPLHGTISYISPTLDEQTRTARARVVLKNSEGRLKPGMFLAAEVEASGRDRKEALAVPEAAIQRMDDEPVVFVGLDERRFQRRAVKLGRVSGGYAEILQGLEPGSVVVTEGSFILKSELSKSQMEEGE